MGTGVPFPVVGSSHLEDLIETTNEELKSALMELGGDDLDKININKSLSVPSLAPRQAFNLSSSPK